MITQFIYSLSVIAFGLAVVFFILVFLSRKAKYRPFIITKIFNRIFLKKRVFINDYATNLQRMKEWYNYDMQGALMAQLIIEEKDKFVFVRPQTQSEDPDIQRMITLETFRMQYREWTRNSRKNYKTALWYVEDSFLTRLIGYRKGVEDRRLSA